MKRQPPHERWCGYYIHKSLCLTLTHLPAAYTSAVSKRLTPLSYAIVINCSATCNLDRDRCVSVETPSITHTHTHRDTHAHTHTQTHPNRAQMGSSVLGCHSE